MGWGRAPADLIPVAPENSAPIELPCSGVLRREVYTKTTRGCQAMRKLRKLTSPSMKMPRCTPRTVSSGTGTLCLFMGNCGPQVGTHHRLGLLLKTSDAELYCACRTRDYVTWSVGTTGRSASSHYRRREICRIQLGQGWYPICGTARRRRGSGLV